MKPSISNLFQKKPPILFSCDSSLSSFNLPVSCFLFWTLPSSSTLNSLQHFAILLDTLRFRLATIHQFTSHSFPRISRTPSAPYQNLSLPVHSSYQVMTSQMSPSPFSKLSDKNFGPVHFLGIFICLLPLPHLTLRYLSASAHHSVRCFVFLTLLVSENPLLFRLPLEPLHSPSIVVPGSGSWPHTAMLHTPPLFPVAQIMLLLLP